MRSGFPRRSPLTAHASRRLLTLRLVNDLKVRTHFGFGKLGEYSDANTGLRPPYPNIHPKNVWVNIWIHFGDGFSGSSEESCFFGSFAFLPFGFGFFCSSPDSCFSCSSSLRRLFSASMIWILSRRRVSSSAAASRCLEVISASRCAYDHLSAVVTSFIKGSMSTRPLFWGSSNGWVSHDALRIWAVPLTEKPLPAHLPWRQDL